MSSSKKNIKNDKMILLKDTIKILKNLVYEHDKEISGILERNQLNIVDIAGLLVNGKYAESELPNGNIIFHTHPFEDNKERKYDPHSDQDSLEIAYYYYKNKNKKMQNSLVLSADGIYTCNLTNKFMKELDSIKNRKLNRREFKNLFKILYNKIRDIGMIYIFKKKDSVKYYKSFLQSDNIDKKYYNNMLDLSKKGITESEYYKKMKNFGYDIKLYKWNSKRMDIQLLKNTKFTNNILTFSNKKEVDKFRKDCSKKELDKLKN